VSTPPVVPETGAAATTKPVWSIDGVNRALGGLGLFGLAIIAGIISYQHGLEVAREAGAAGLVAYLVPLVADLLIATSSLSILDAARNGGDRPVFAWIALVVGVIGTVVMNVAAAWGKGLWPCLLNGGVPVALILSYEALMEMVRRARKLADAKENPGHSDPASGQCPHLPAMAAEQAPLIAFLHARDCDGSKPTLRQYAKDWSISRTTLSDMVKRADGITESVQMPEPSLNGSAATP
jgi:hypothetical protein